MMSLRKTLLTVMMLSMFVFVGCTDGQNDGTTAINLSSNNSLAISTYLASSLLPATTQTTTSVSNDDSNVKIVPLTEDTPNLEIESELDTINEYFDKLKALMDGGMEEILNVTPQTSTLVEYEYEITYVIDEITYKIYYSIVEPTVVLTDEEDEANEEESENEEEEVEDDANEEEEMDEEEAFNLVGLLVIGEVSYQISGGNENDGTEQKMWFETNPLEDSNNYVKVEIKKEDDEQKFFISSSIDGIASETKMKFEEEDDEVKIELELLNGENESHYEFKRELEGTEYVYKFEYEMNDVKGEVEVVKVVDIDGNETYEYRINEDGEEKEIEKDDPDEDDDDEEEQEDTSLTF
ncbi:MAG: hypothetical protein AB7V00_06110 [Bacilli bacterium]